MARVLSIPRPARISTAGQALTIGNIVLLRVALSYLAPAYLLLLSLVFANDLLGRICHCSIKFYSPGVFLFQSPVFNLKYYGLFLLLGLVATLVAAIKSARWWQLSTEEILIVYIYGMVFGSLGARLYYVALCWPHFMRFPQEIFNASLGGLSIHGCILGSFLAMLICARVRGHNPARYFDFVCTLLPLAQSIWRWGNLFNSEAVGAPVSSCALLQQLVPLAARPSGYGQWGSFHPAFLYESFWDLTLFCCLYFGLAKMFVKRPGILSCIYLGAYSLGRILIESVRLDGITYGTLPVPTIVSLGCLIAAAAGLLVLLLKPAQPAQVST